MKVAWAALSLCTFTLFGQYPGQPPGTGPYPGDRFPGQDPSRRRPTQTRPGDARRPKAQTVVTTTEGILRRYAGRQLVIEADDHRIVWYRTAETTIFQKDGASADPATWQTGDQVSVDSTTDENDLFTASAIRNVKPGSATDRAAASRTWDLPALESGAAAPSAPRSPSSPPRGDGDERPRLRRNNPGSQPAEAAAPQPAQTAEAPPTPEAPPQPTTTVRPPDAPSDADDPGRPVLRRGIPPPRKRSTVAEADRPVQSPVAAAAAGAPASAAPPEPPAPPREEPPAEDPLLTKAREAAASYADSLPNFFCKQTTTRYQSNDPKRGWDPVDIVTADLAYENGKESYKNIHVGGKPAKGTMFEIGGATSTGEFQTILDEILSPGRATFRRAGSDSIGGREAIMFKYEVTREMSRWRIQAPSQLYYPAYRGTLFIDRETARILRVEMQGRSLPQRFSFDTIETAVDYSSVRLTATNTYVLPVSAELLSCERGSTFCSRNRIEFRNYRKFGSESSITFEDK